MTNQSNLHALTFLLFVVMALSGFAPRAMAMTVWQDTPFKPGDKVEYKASNWPEKWEAGSVVKILPGGTQVLIREKPNEFFKDGFERAYNLADVRRIVVRAPNNPPANPNPKRDNEAPADNKPRNQPGGSLMTKEEVLNFLNARLGDRPFQHPEREQIRKELAKMIKRRGVSFRYEALSDFANQLARFGATSDITFPLTDNYGPPTKQGWLIGSWSMDIIGATVDTARNNRVVRQGEMGAKGGRLTINPDNTYLWQAYANDPPAKHIKGTWRAASAEEMKYQGGDGIVLQAAKSSWDWIVMQDRAAPNGEWIRVADITSRQMREFGKR